jgi:hypothetical protein
VVLLFFLSWASLTPLFRGVSVEGMQCGAVSTVTVDGERLKQLGAKAQCIPTPY